ncbi:MAG: hypothetical protein B7L53_09405 [Thermofilum sp. NZ13]|nr:MAG: hypothetical protein B7L53_09405 [Thermofilum sp. NZ13]
MVRKWTTHVLSIDLTVGLDRIWNDIARQTREEIKKAERIGIEIHINKHFDEFYEINKKFALKKNLKNLILPIDFMRRYGTLFTAVYNNKVLGGVLFFEDERVMELKLMASLRLETSKDEAKIISHAMRLLIWRAIQYAYYKGLSEFSLEGVDPSNLDSGIGFFKTRFGGTVVTRYNYVLCHPYVKILYNIYRKMRNA